MSQAQLPEESGTPNEREIGRLLRSFAIRSVTASDNADATDNTILVDTSGGNRTITLPAAALCQERVITVKKTTGDANTVTIAAASGETIDGASTAVLSTQWQAFALHSDGTSWSIIWDHDTSTPANIAAEAATRAAADSAEAATRASADSTEATNRANADSLLQAKSEKNAASGYAGLDASSKLTGSQQVYGTAANTACQGNDARLSDSRAPSGSAGGDLTGTYPNPTVGANKVAVGQMHASATDVLFGRSTAAAGAGEEIACTAAGRALIDDANAAAQRTTMGAADSSYHTHGSATALSASDVDGQLGTSFTTTIRDTTNGGTVTVIYENGQVPVLLTQPAGATVFVTGVAAAGQIQIKDRGGSGGIAVRANANRNNAALAWSSVIAQV